MTRARALVWVLAGVLVVAAGRQVAYALTGGTLAERLSSSGGGPGVAWVAAVALAGSAAVAVAGVWLVACGVRERCALELEGWAATPAGVGVSALARRTIVLSAAATAAFTVVESSLHFEEGLGFHGWHCIAGPVHQNAAPILVALSLLAAACVTAADLVLGSLRRAVARRLIARRVLRPRSLCLRLARVAAIVRRHTAGANPTRGPPGASLPSPPAPKRAFTI